MKNTTYLIAKCRIFCYSIFGDGMISFEWNGIQWNIGDLGGGRLQENIAGHAHSKNSYELHFITGGRGTLITEDKKYDLKSGDFFVTGPNIYHAQETDAAEPTEDVFIYLQKNGGQMHNLFASAFINTHFYFTEHFDHTIAKALLDEYRQKQPDYKSAVQGLAIQLLTQIVRCYLPPDAVEYAESDNLYDKRFIIIENSLLYDPNITLTQLSEKIGVCPRQTERLLRKYYGKTFREKKKEQK